MAFHPDSISLSVVPSTNDGLGLGRLLSPLAPETDPHADQSRQ
jgi:hypothetical protein